MLVDLNLFLKPRLYIMDGITAMEGNGPRGGNPKQMNVLLFSQDPVALDATVCKIISIKPEFIPTLVAGKFAGLGTFLEDEIELLGDPIETFINLAFDIEREKIKPYEPRKVMSFLKNRLVPKPTIIESKCTRCGTCVQVCPVSPKAVDWHAGNKKNPPSYKYDRCIRCYCCQELCPENAVYLKAPFVRRLFRKRKK